MSYLNSSGRGVVRVEFPQSLPDRVLQTLYIGNEKIGTLEVLFGAPCSDEPGAPLLSLRSCCFTREQRAFYDIHVAVEGVQTTSTGTRRGVPVIQDLSWMRKDLMPEALKTVNSQYSPGTSLWRRRIVDLNAKWIENCVFVQEQEKFGATISKLHDRMAFEFHSFLCGIGETSMPWDYRSIAMRPWSWSAGIPRVLGHVSRSTASNTAMTSRVSSSSSPTGMGMLTLTIPLMLSDHDVILERAHAFTRLFRSVATDREAIAGDQDHSTMDLDFGCCVEFDIELMQSGYRVVRDELQMIFTSAASSLFTNEEEASSSPLRVSSTSGSEFSVPSPYSQEWWIHLLRSCCVAMAFPQFRGESPRAPVTTSTGSPSIQSPALSPRVVLHTQGATSSPSSSAQIPASQPLQSSPSSAPTSSEVLAGTSVCPSFREAHRMRNATLMEYIPQLEHSIRVALCEPVHFLELVDVLSSSFGKKPTVVNPTVCSLLGERVKRYALFHLLDVASDIEIVVAVTYEGVDKMPTVTVGRDAHTMPGTNKPLSARIRTNAAEALRFNNTAVDDSDEVRSFDIQAMTAAVVRGVDERAKQIVQICTMMKQQQEQAAEEQQKHEQQQHSVEAPCVTTEENGGTEGIHQPTELGGHDGGISATAPEPSPAIEPLIDMHAHGQRGDEQDCNVIAAERDTSPVTEHIATIHEELIELEICEAEGLTTEATPTIHADAVHMSHHRTTETPTESLSADQDPAKQEPHCDRESTKDTSQAEEC